MTPDRSLGGFRVGVTADRRWEEQAMLFERRGASTLHGPAIRTLPLDGDEHLREMTEDVIARAPDALIANTGVGMRSWFAAAESWGLGRALQAALASCRIYARGPKASGAVHSATLDVVARPPSERLADVVELALARLRPGQRAVLQLDGSGASAEVARLADAGIDVVAVPVYRWVLPEDRRPALRLAEGIIAGNVHAVTFTAGPTVHNLMTIACDEGLGDDLRAALTDGRALVGCVGPVCADAAIGEGLSPDHIVQPELFRLGPLVRAVADRVLERRLVVQTGATEIVVSGTMATVAGKELSLSGTEARLLATLASKPNTVFSKEQLLRVVWGSTSEDPRTVEVAIGRLRRRLGPHGNAVCSVHRRGYTLRT